jgi:predicted short-subunit dehydrogenase-like oxidoreductase (DUF2520 family)
LVHHSQLGSIDEALVPEQQGSVSATGDGPLSLSPELVLLCVPDAEVAGCAALLPKREEWVVAHCAGSLELEVLGDHHRVASVHPLVSLPDPDVGAQRLVGAWFAVSGDDAASEVVQALQGTPVSVRPGKRAAYHAAASVASNHLVALLAEVERIAAVAGVPLEAYLDLVRGTVDNVAELGVSRALTGPVARGDWDTVRAHLDAIGLPERDQYVAGLAAIAAMTERELPWGTLLGDPNG